MAISLVPTPPRTPPTHAPPQLLHHPPPSQLRPHPPTFRTSTDPPHHPPVHISSTRPPLHVSRPPHRPTAHLIIHPPTPPPTHWRTFLHTVCILAFLNPPTCPLVPVPVYRSTCNTWCFLSRLPLEHDREGTRMWQPRWLLRGAWCGLFLLSLECGGREGRQRVGMQRPHPCTHLPSHPPTYPPTLPPTYPPTPPVTRRRSYLHSVCALSLCVRRHRH